MTLDDVIKLVQTLGFPILVAVWFMRRDDRVNTKLMAQNSRMLRGLALIASALEAREAVGMLNQDENGEKS